MPRIEVRGIIVPNDDKRFYEWFGYEATSPRDVGSVLEEAGGETVDVYINSPGGEIASGSEIYSMLREYGNVKIHITGQACSAASVIAMSGWCEMASTALMMIHCVSTRAAGNRAEMEHTASVLKAADDAISTAYTAKTGKDRDEILEMMEAETWITAEKAVELGLIDQVMGQEEKEPAQMAAGTMPLLTEEQKEQARCMMEAKERKSIQKAAEARARLRLLNLNAQQSRGGRTK